MTISIYKNVPDDQVIERDSFGLPRHFVSVSRPKNLFAFFGVWAVRSLFARDKCFFKVSGERRKNQSNSVRKNWGILER
jgi:hypothetical protein